MSRLIIVSNRLPVSISRQKGEFVFSESVGGLATGMSSLEHPKDRLWFGWPGIPNNKLRSEDRVEISRELKSKENYPVFLSSKNIRDFYSGFSNKTLWPLFHYFSELTIFDENYWYSYKEVNQIFCDEVLKHAKKDDTIWVHDYQLMLLPNMIRQKMPDAKIGFFLHIPFPSFELLRNLPWRSEILQGILGADLIGFHEYDYVRHFLSSAYRILGIEHQLSKFIVENRLVRVDAFPMGINFDKYANSRTSADVKKEIEKLKKNDTKLILSVDRLDYTKGILHRLEAYDWFLTKNPKYRGKVSLIMVAVPSRTKVDQYILLRERIEKIVGRINGSYGDVNWTPVSYMYRSLPFDQLSALYNVADIALITPLRDGMNLVAKEFVAAQHEKPQQACLIISEMAGAAAELSEAVVINPHDKEQAISAIKHALEMPQNERKKRNDMMLSRISRYTVGRWANDFINSLEAVKLEQTKFITKHFSPAIQKEVAQSYNKSDKRLILLDYDGTLVPFSKLPEDAMPDKEIFSILEKLTGDSKNEVVIISGRDKETLEKWLGHLPLNMIAEHGAFYKIKNQSWITTLQQKTDWKNVILPILDLFVDRTPGSLIEEKKSSLVWHFRKSDPELAKLRTHELKETIVVLATNLNIGVFEGNKIIEIKPVTINKGEAIQRLMSEKPWPFIFCVGDDYTDEDMFTALPDGAVSCKIGTGISAAKYRLNSPERLRKFLNKLTS